jgi:serine/threonine protein kinase
MFLAMAFYEGETLRRRIERGPLPLEEALEVAVAIARGLERAHQAGILHRDIKPANVMLTSRGEVKVVDFGLAKLAETSRLTQEGTTLGTPAYMSPEQVRGDEADGRSDLWSLGVVLHEMLAGAPPFKGGSASAVFYSILNEEPPRLGEEGKSVPPAVQAVIGRTLAKRRDERHPSASALLADLEELRRGSERTLTRILPVRAVRRRRFWTAAGVAALLVAAALAFVLASWPSCPSPSGAARISATWATASWTS